MAQVYGVALLCGIGVTMGLFIDVPAFGAPILFDEVKIGIVFRFLLSALAGALLSPRSPDAEDS